MASTDCEIRWINHDKRYGLFAKERIPAATEVIGEWGTMIDISQLIDLINTWEKHNTQKLSLSKETKAVLADQVNLILTSMKTLNETVKNNPKYESAMRAHRAQPRSTQPAEIRNEEVSNEETTPIRSHPLLTIDLYKESVNIDGTKSNEALLSVLEGSLHDINTFLSGVVAPPDLRVQFWGPYTSLLNHGCKPKAVFSYCLPPAGWEGTRPNQGPMTVKTLDDIEVGQEITLEYMAAVGPAKRRREQLRKVGIAKCHCQDCDDEEKLERESETDEASKKAYEVLLNRGNLLLACHHRDISEFYSYPPHAFYPHVHRILRTFAQDKYHGCLIPKLYQDAIDYAKIYNDHIRVHWFAVRLCWYIEDAYSKSHTFYLTAEQQFLDALNHKPYNAEPAALETQTIVTQYPTTDTDISIIFMLKHPFTPDHHLLVTSEGRLRAVSKADNLAHVQKLLPTPSSISTSTSTPTTQEEAEALAAEAAAALTAAEDDEAAKLAARKSKKTEKAKRQRERKRAADAELAAATTAAEARRAVVVAAVRAATVVPALPLPLLLRGAVPCRERSVPAPATAPRQTPPPHHRVFRSSSFPELAVIERWMAGVPLREHPSRYEDDVVSESEMEIRFWGRV